MSRRPWCNLPAREVVRALARGETTTEELLEACEQRLRSEDVSALHLVENLGFERARKIRSRGDGAPGDLHGLPIMAKATHAVRGMVYSQGLLRHATRIASIDDPLVEHLERHRGAVVYATSNAPALAMGGHTFNAVAGGTRNPHDPERSAGGSSGGSAASLAVGAAWLAIGSDLAGSCRTPASFCGVVGMRPSPGIVPRVESNMKSAVDPSRFGLRFENGPMARDVEDLALFLDALDPNSIREETSYQRAAMDRNRTLRVAWTSDFGGTAPVEPKVADACLRAAQWLADGKVSFDSPDVVDASSIHHILRAHQMHIRHRALMETGMDDLPEEVRWQLQQGEAITQQDLEWATAAHDAYQSRFEGFMNNFDVLACPAAAVLPFPAQNRWVEWVGDEQMENYVEWLRHTYVVSLANVPAISLPCGWTQDGLPIGIQLVARRGEDRLLLSAAASLQEKVSREMIANGQPAFGVVVKSKLDATQIGMLPPMPDL